MGSRDNGYGSLDDGKSGGRMGSVVWDDSTVTVLKPPGKGFGLAISGGVDRPYLNDGDPSIMISDVLPGGPAEGKLKVNDRVISVNGEFMKRVRHEVALNALRRSGERVTMNIQRKRIIPPPQTVTDSPAAVPQQHRIEIHKSPSEGYGMRLGWKLYVQGLNESGVAARAGVTAGDKIDTINGISAETLSLIQVRKEIELSQDSMTLEIMRDPDDIDGLRGKQMMVPVYPEAPQRPPSPPPQDFVNGEPVNEPEGEERQINYMKGKNVGLRLVGGNEVGIYVAAIQPGSQAESAGIAVGDRVKEINETELRSFTKEDVILLLLTISSEIRLTVVHSRASFRKISQQKRGDKFFIKSHFTYEAPSGQEIQEMNFKKGSVFRIVDTLPDNNMGYWDAVLLSRQNTLEGRGLIPNKNRAEQIGFTVMRDEYSKPANIGEGRGGFFKRRGLRASMSVRGKPVIKDHWDEVIFSGRPMKSPAYERVVLRQVDFKRPVVIFGPLADIARKKMIENLPDNFEEPITQHSVETVPGETMRLNQQGNVKLSAIKDIMDQQKHCILDITPNAVEHLNYHQLYPIVIFLNAENRSTVKAIRGQHLTPEENKGSRKLYQTAKKVKSSFQNIFTAMIPLTNYKDHRKDDWIRYCQDAIRLQQDREIWVSESKFEEDEEEDDTELPLIGSLALPEGYDTDAASSYMSGNESQPDSDWDKEPTSPNESTNENNFTYQNEPEITQRDVLPVTAMVVPPPDKYPSDDEKDLRRSRPRQKKRAKKDAMNWARERSRSRSRDRRSVGPISDEEDETDDIQNKDWRLIASERGNQSWTPTERPSRKEQQRKREEEKRLARELARDSLPPGTEFNMEPSPTVPVSQSTPQDNHRRDEPDKEEPPVPLQPEFQPQEEEQLQAQVRYGVESAPMPTETNYDYSGPASYQQQEPAGYEQQPSHYRQDDPAPYRQEDHAPSAPYRQADHAPYRQEDHAPYRQEEHAPYRQEDNAPYRQDDPAHYQQDEPTSYYHEQPDPYQLQEPSYQAEPYEDTPPDDREIPVNVVHQDVVHSAPPTAEEETDLDPAPAWGLPDTVSNAPPTYQPPPPPAKKSVKPSPDPVYAQVHKAPPAPQPAKRQPSPRTVPEKPVVVERKVVSVTSSVVNAEVYKVDLQNGVEEEEEDDYKRQLASVSYSQFAALPSSDQDRSSPYQDRGRSSPHQNQQGRSSPYQNNQGRSSPHQQEKPKPQVDPKKAREEWFLGQDDPVQRSRPGDKPYQPDKDSYRAYREKRNTRSKSPGRQYQEKTGIYGPKGWGQPKTNLPKPVPVSEEAFNSDEGQEVVATARGTFTSRGGTLASPETGVSIKIPPGAIPGGISQEVYFKVCRDNSMLPPLDTDKGETLLSPLVMCGPHGLKFQKPVELNLPHTASNTPEGWSFNLKSSDTPAGEAAEWKNMSISDKPGGAAVGQKTVSVMVEHF